MTKLLSDDARVSAHAMLPSHCAQPLIDYFDEKHPVGGFLTAVLANDLVGAGMRADRTNQEHLFEYANWLAWYAPSLQTGSWGNYDNVKDWIEKGVTERENSTCGT